LSIGTYNEIFHHLLRCHGGATAIEYGLIAALIAVAIMTTVGGLGSTLRSTFSKTSSGVSSSAA
jgi:pilus assembly protein Flp/PilA